MIATRHPRLREVLMAEWLRDLSDRGSNALPDQHAIMARFDFDDTEQARTLIAQMADGGIIKVARHSGYSTFTILPPKPPRCAVSTVHRMVESDTTDEADDGELDTVDRKHIDMALKRIKRAMLPPVAKKRAKIIPRNIPELPTVETVSAKRENPDAGNPIPAKQDHGPTAVTPPASSSAVAAEVENEPVIPRPQPVEARQPAPKLPANAMRFNGAKSGQVNIKPPADVWDQIVAEAKARSLPISTIAREIFMRAFASPAAAPMPKPRIPAAVMRAYLADGRPFDQFMTDALLLGVEAMAAFRQAAE